jgi:hypothetical protein
VRGAGFLAAITGAAAAWGGACAPRGADTFAWTPPAAVAVTRGREVATRFDLLPLTEITIQVDNAFGTGNREVLAVAEQRLSEVPGVRRVFGPAGLLEVSVDQAGQAVARPVLAGASHERGEGTRGPWDPGAVPYEAEGEAVRQRVVRRADALGWFVSANGRVVRFLIDSDDFEQVRPGVEAVLAASGLGLARPPADGGMVARALWPDPRGRGARWLPAALAAGWVLFVLVAGLRLRPSSVRGTSRFGPLSRGRVAALVLGAVAGGAALFLRVPIGGVRAAGVRAGAAAAVVVLLALLLERRLAPGRRPPTDGGHRGGRPPTLVMALSLAVVVAAAVAAPRLRVGTHQWDEAPLAFVSVRGELDEPVVLREVRRLTDFLRAQPGVASAWSVADLFAGVQAEGEEASRIPDDADIVRRALVQARTDPALRLELAGDHHEALVGVRFDEEAPADRLDLAARLGLYLETDLRAAVLHVDLGASGLSPVTRAVGRSLLASDTSERVARIAARSGRALSPVEAASVERISRQAALVPMADAGRLRSEITAAVRGQVAALAAQQGWPARPGEQDRLAADLAALPDDAGPAEVQAALAASAALAGRIPPPALGPAAAALARRIAVVRRRHTARINFKDMLYGADLPTEGVLADEVRSATLEGMGPVVGVPVVPDSIAAFRIDAAFVGGAANDRALSVAWTPALRAGVVGAASVLTALLILVAGARGLVWLPIALAPLSAGALPAALLREPLGLWSLSFLAGAYAAGAVIALGLAGRRQAA